MISPDGTSAWGQQPDLPFAMVGRRTDRHRALQQRKDRTRCEEERETCDILPEGWTIDGAGWSDPQGNYRSTSEGPPPGSNSSGVIALANAIPDMGALSVTNVMGNKIGKEQLAKLQEIMRSKPSLVSLCGIADAATGADLSGLKMDADDAIVLASELLDKGTMTSLNLASNELYAEGAKIIAEAIKVTKCAPAIILAPFSCPSDFSINCCCLLLSAGYGGDDELACWHEPDPRNRDEGDHCHGHEKGEHKDALRGAHQGQDPHQA
jgi:hypothetical protein